MPVNVEDVQEGKCYATTIKGKPAIARVVQIIAGEIRSQEAVGTVNEKEHVQRVRRIRWEYRFAFPPNSRWIPGNHVLSIREFVAPLDKEVSCT